MSRAFIAEKIKYRLKNMKWNTAGLEENAWLV
jgi:hypothetical protein